MKLLFDTVMSRENQSILDNQEDARAWAALKLSIATDAQTAKQLAVMQNITSAQTGETEDQQTVSPVRTGTGDAIVGSVGVSADTVAASQANLLSAMTPVIATAVSNSVNSAYQVFLAALPTLITAMGGASTPSQTQAKPTETA
jgi:hypothetical protein